MIESAFRHSHLGRQIVRILFITCCLGIGAGIVSAQQPLRFEAEDVT